MSYDELNSPEREIHTYKVLRTWEQYSIPAAELANELEKIDLSERDFVSLEVEDIPGRYDSDPGYTEIKLVFSKSEPNPNYEKELAEYQNFLTEEKKKEDDLKDKFDKGIYIERCVSLIIKEKRLRRPEARINNPTNQVDKQILLNAQENLNKEISSLKECINKYITMHPDYTIY